MFDSEHFPAIQQEYPKSAQDFFQNTQDSIYHRVVYWIKSKKPEKLSIEGLELLKAPDWAYLLKQAIKRNFKEVISSILAKSGKIIRENEASKILILQTAYFFQEKFDPEIIKLLNQWEIALKDEQNYDIGNFYTWEKMKNDGSIFAYDEIGQTVSHYAAARGDKKFFQWLAEKENLLIFRTLMTTKSKQGDYNPLHIAVQCCSDNIIELIISKYNQNLWIKEAIQSEINSKGEIILFLAAKRGNLTIFKSIFEFCQDKSNQKLIFNKKGFSIENICCQLSRSEIIKFLENLDSYFELSPENQILALKNGKNNFQFFLYLISGAVLDHRYFLSQKYGNFLEKCSLLNCTAYQGNLALHKEFFAKCQDQLETKTYGKLSQIIDDLACNSLQAAIKKGHFHIVDYLISKKLYLKNWYITEKNEKKTPLEVAKFYGHKDIEQLLEHAITCSTLLETNNQNEFNLNELKNLPFYLDRICFQGSILECATIARNPQLVQQILSKKANINIQNYEGKTPLWYCIDPLDIELFQLLISNGASLFIADHLNFTPIHLLIKLGLQDILQNLWKNNGPQKGCVSGINPIFQALLIKQSDIAKLLCYYLPKALYNQKDILFFSVEKNYISFIELLIKIGIQSNKLDVQNIQFETPLLLALAKRNEKAANIFLDNGASISIQNINKQTALYLAIEQNCSSSIILKILHLEEKCKFISPNRSKLLTYTIKENNQEVFDLLLKYNTAINITEKLEIDNPVYEALLAQNEQQLAAFLKKEPNICQMHSENRRNLLSIFAVCESIKHFKKKLKILEKQICFDWFRDDLDIDGLSPLFQALKNNNLRIVCWLLENGAKFIDTPNACNENLLTQAIINGNFEIVEQLLKQNFDVNKQNSKGETALIKAIVLNNGKMVKFLLDKRPNIEINKQNFEGETPILIAFKKQNVEIIKLLLSNNQINLNIADKKTNYPLLCLPFEDLDATLAILKMIFPIKNRIDCLVSANNENMLLKAMKLSTLIKGDPKKKLLFQKISKIIINFGFSKNLSSIALNKKDKEMQTALDIALNSRDLFRIAKLFVFWLQWQEEPACQSKKIAYGYLANDCQNDQHPSIVKKRKKMGNSL